jgi:hypothetical protein
MAQTKPTGLDASITFLSAHNLCADMFELERSQQLIPIGCFGDTHQTYAGGMQSGAFTVEGKPIANAASTDPGFGAMSATAASIVFTCKSGCTVTINGIVTNMRWRAVWGGEQRLAYVGVTSGAPTVVWATS